MPDTDDIDINDLLPESHRRPAAVRLDDEGEAKLIADLYEARSKVTATDYSTARDQGIAAMREVLHRHGMVMSDEVD